MELRISECNVESDTADPSVPVYQPTPISELDKYSPGSLSTYKINDVTYPTNPIFQSQPTYSPIIKTKTNLAFPSVFTYQPSPIHGVKQNVPVSVNVHEVIELNNDSDEEISFESKLNPKISKQQNFKSLIDSTVVANKLPKSDSSELLIPLCRSGNVKTKIGATGSSLKPSSTGCQRPKKNTELDENDGEEPQNLKRQKILSLYEDLYGASEPKSPKTDVPIHPNRILKSRTIIPYNRPDIQNPVSIKTMKEISSNDAKLVKTVNDCPVLPDVTRPRVPLRKSNRIPMPIRTRYLDQFIEECLLIYEFSGDAYERALNDEQACHDKAATRMAYLNAVIQRLKSLSSEKSAIKRGDSKQIPANVPTTIGLVKCDSNSTNSRQNPNCEPKQSVYSLLDMKADAEANLDNIVQGPLLYDRLKTYVLSEDELMENGYPSEFKEYGKVVHNKANLRVPQNRIQAYGVCQSNQRVCCRCGTFYRIDEFGQSLSKEECVYHWGKPIKQRIPGRGHEVRYVCCQAEVDQPGCQVCHEGHVHGANKWLDNCGFVTTLPPLPASDLNHENETNPSVNVYALDCEMVYTTGGCELARITIIDSKIEVVLDEIVRPENPVIDCNFRFSGLRLEQIEQATERITDIQSKLLHLFDSGTILIGHSLENDLIALKLIHSNVVDTSLMFPHRLGPPHKRALRNLASDTLHTLIQQNECGGHNSAEDAIACMNLVHYKIKEDLRNGKWV